VARTKEGKEKERKRGDCTFRILHHHRPFGRAPHDEKKGKKEEKESGGGLQRTAFFLFSPEGRITSTRVKRKKGEKRGKQECRPCPPSPIEITKKKKKKKRKGGS